MAHHQRSLNDIGWLSFLEVLFVPLNPENIWMFKSYFCRSDSHIHLIHTSYLMNCKWNWFKMFFLVFYRNRTEVLSYSRLTVLLCFHVATQGAFSSTLKPCLPLSCLTLLQLVWSMSDKMCLEQESKGEGSSKADFERQWQPIKQSVAITMFHQLDWMKAWIWASASVESTMSAQTEELPSPSSSLSFQRSAPRSLMITNWCQCSFICP